MTSSQSHNHDPAYLRDARREDIPTILQIITPYVEQHVLMPRDANDLEKLIPHGFDAEADGQDVGLAAVEIYSSKLGEFQRLAV